MAAAAGTTGQPDFLDAALRPEMPTRRAVCRIVLGMLANVKNAEAGIIDDLDAEYLHRWRVSLRKARSLLGLLGEVFPDKAELRNTLKEFMVRTGELRDLDVALLEESTYRLILTEDLQGGLNSLFAYLRGQRYQARETTAAWLVSTEYRESRDQLIEFFRGANSLPDTPCSRIPLITTVRISVWKRYTKFALRGREITPDTPDGAIHKLRIIGKKLRYLFDFFSPLFPMETAAPLAMGLKMIQKSLGVFNDYSVQEEFLRTIAANHRDTDPEMVPAVEALTAILAKRKHAQRGRVVEVLGPFCTEETAERFRDIAGPASEAAQGAVIAR